MCIHPAVAAARLLFAEYEYSRVAYQDAQHAFINSMREGDDEFIIERRAHEATIAFRDSEKLFRRYLGEREMTFA